MALKPQPLSLDAPPQKIEEDDYSRRYIPSKRLDFSDKKPAREDTPESRGVISFSDKMRHLGGDADEISLRDSPAKKRRPKMQCEILDDIPASPFKKSRKAGFMDEYSPKQLQLVAASPAKPRLTKKRSSQLDLTPNAKPSRSSAAF